MLSVLIPSFCAKVTLLAPSAKANKYADFFIVMALFNSFFTFLLRECLHLSIIFGVRMLVAQPILLKQGWMLAKLVFVLLLVAYHYASGAIYNQFKNDIVNYTSVKMRLWNEVATILLFAIVFLVELQNEMNALIGLGGFVGVSLLLMSGVKIYKQYRQKKGEL